MRTLIPLCVLSLSLVGCNELSEKLSGKAKGTQVNSSALSSNEMSDSEVKDMYLKNRKTIENYQEGHQTLYSDSGMSSCEGVDTPYSRVATNTIIKIVDDEAYSLEEKVEQECGKEYKTKRLIQANLDYMSYKEMDEKFIPQEDVIYRKISDSQVEIKLKPHKDHEFQFTYLIDYSKPGLEYQMEMGKTKIEYKYLGIVDVSKIDVDGLKVNVWLPGSKNSRHLVETDKTLKDLFPAE